MKGVWLFLLLATVVLLGRGAAKLRYINSWAVEVPGGAEIAEEVARKHGFINKGQIGNLKNHYHFVLAEAKHEHLPQKSEILALEDSVGYVQQQMLRSHVKREYIVPADPDWINQWSLKNSGQTNGPPGLDLNVEPAWLQGITGEGVVVGIVDDGLEKDHPDLADNFDAYASYDFIDNDPDPTPDYSADYTDEPNRHGTSCAGEVGMVKNNICGIGVAYECTIAGLKINLGGVGDLMEAEALGHMDDYIHIYSNSWGPSDLGFFVLGPGVLVQRTLDTGVTSGRNGKGSIYVWASGNGGGYYDSCAADGYSSSIYTIAVGSADQRGRQAFYDEDCAGKMAVTFSYNSDTFGESPYQQVRTTTIHGGCTDDFTGTSASAPLVSGSIALALQANSNLTWRDVQYLIVYTSNPTILSGGGWTTNGAGLNVSHKFGFGAIDAEAMVTRAQNWILVPEQRSQTIGSSSGIARPNETFTTPFEISADNPITFLEHVVVTMTMSIEDHGPDYDYSDFDSEAGYSWLTDPHPRRGDIQVELTSPQGTKSVLLPYRKFDFINDVGYKNWPFMSLHHWGEDPVGIWTLKVNFRSSAGYVQISNVSMTLYGTAETPAAVQRIPLSCDPACARGCAASGPEYCDACAGFRNASTLECVGSCGNSTTEYDGYCVEGQVVYPTASPSDIDNRLVLILGVSVSLVLVVLLLLLVAVAVALGYSFTHWKKQGWTQL